MMAAALLLAACPPTDAVADYIQPVAVQGAGSYSNNPLVLDDGVLPARGTFYATTASVFWTSTTTSFTLDFGSVQTVASLIVSVDNDDNYLIQSSTDVVHFSDLFTFLSTDGPVAPVPGGLDTMTTNPAFPLSVPYPGDLTTAEYVGRAFAPTAARYLRLFGSGGDGRYGTAEVDAFTAAAVPEPSSFVLCGIAALTFMAGASSRRSRRRAAANPV